MEYSFEAPIEKQDSSILWNYRIAVPLHIANELIDKNKRVVCTINGLPSFQCALTPDGSGEYFISVNKEIRKKLDTTPGHPLEVVLEKDKSTYGLPVPEEFEELLHQDPEGNQLFHALTPGKQRNLLYIIGKPKSSQKKLEKAIIVLDYLKSTGGLLDFKELNIAFKNSRFK